MTALSPYRSYTESGLDWSGDVPGHWDLVQLARLADEKKVKNTGLQESKVLSLSYGRIITKSDIYAGLSPADFSTYQIVEPGNIILRMTDLQNDQRSLRVGLAESRGIITSAYVCLRPSEFMEPRFLYRMLHDFDVKKMFYGMGAGVRQGLSYKELRKTVFPIPPSEEQQAIADFLGGMDARIARFIAARRKMIALLEEKKQAVITRAVTRGLNPEVPMKDSGIDWLGEIPAHWELRRSRYVFREVDLRATDESLPRLSMSQKYGLVPNTDIEAWRLQSTSAIGAKVADQDDLVLNRLKAHLAVFAHAPIRGTVSPDYTVLRPIPPASVRYFEALYRTPRYRDEFFKRTKGIVEGFWRLYTDAFYDVPVPYPNPEEQQAIANYIDGENARTSALIKRHQREIELMQEYRTRLISDVVTGKLDVRGVDLPAVEEVVGEEIEAAMEEESPEKDVVDVVR